MQSQVPCQRIRNVCCAITLGVLTLSCSADPEPIPQASGLAPSETYGDWGGSTPTSAAVSPTASTPGTSASATTTNAASDDAEVAETAPESLALTDGYTRTTADGIRLTGGPTTFDYGNGSEPSFEVSARSGSGLAGVVVPREPAWPLEGAVDTLGWALSGDTFAVIILASGDVSSLRVLGINGSTDETKPTEGIAVAGVSASSIDDITIEAIDATGNIIGTCVVDDGFLTCE